MIAVVSSACFRLVACSREGELESQVVEFAYEDIERLGLDDEEMAFALEVKLPNKPNKSIKIYTGFVSFVQKKTVRYCSCTIFQRSRYLTGNLCFFR